MARPKLDVSKSKTINLRLTEEDFNLLSRAADRCGLSLSAYLRGQGKSAALMILNGR